MSNLKFIITEPDDKIRSVLAEWDTSGAEASDFLKGLSSREITQIVQDQELKPKNLFYFTQVFCIICRFRSNKAFQ